MEDLPNRNTCRSDSYYFAIAITGVVQNINSKCICSFPEVIQLVSSSIQLSMNFQMLTKTKMLKITTFHAFKP